MYIILIYIYLILGHNMTRFLTDFMRFTLKVLVLSLKPFLCSSISILLRSSDTMLCDALVWTTIRAGGFLTSRCCPLVSLLLCYEQWQ